VLFLPVRYRYGDSISTVRFLPTCHRTVYLFLPPWNTILRFAIHRFLHFWFFSCHRDFIHLLRTYLRFLPPLHATWKVPTCLHRIYRTAGSYVLPLRYKYLPTTIFTTILISFTDTVPVPAIPDGCCSVPTLFFLLQFDYTFLLPFYHSCSLLFVLYYFHFIHSVLYHRFILPFYNFILLYHSVPATHSVLFLFHSFTYIYR